MYIEPNTDIWLLNDVRIDSTYNDTIYWTSRIDQFNYFSSKIKYHLDENTYQRVQKGRMRVGLKADLIYDVDYLMFRNTNYGNKVFYAFVNRVEYINNEVSEVEFEIDVMQTWALDYTVINSFVEREHSEHDSVGYNIVPENVELGEVMYSNPHGLTDGGYTTIVATTGKIALDIESYTRVYDNVLSGLLLKPFDTSEIGVASLQMYLRGFTGDHNAIVSMYTLPSWALNDVYYDSDNYILGGSKGANIIKTITGVTGTESFGDYVPKNKKLYTYPYNYLTINNGGNEALCLRYEYFNGDPSFNIESTITQPVQVVLYPRNYKGQLAHSDATLSGMENLSLDNFPLCSWSYSYFLDWLARNTVPMIAGGVATALTANVASGLSSSLALSNPTPEGVARGLKTSQLQADATRSANIINGISSSLSQGYTASITANPCKGNISNGNILVSHNRQRFWWFRTHINEQYAIMIDDYFTKYGYACKRVKKPGFTNRPHWNYIKTIGCEIWGSIPNDDKKLICSIMDKGITFWRHGEEVGNYGLDNSPVEPHNE